jgi:hypothetical protein
MAKAPTAMMASPAPAAASPAKPPEEKKHDPFAGLGGL